MPESNELSQRITALEKRVNRLEAEISSVRSELSNKLDSNNSAMMDRVIELERERVRLATILDHLEGRLEVLSKLPTFESGFQAKVTQFTLFCAAAAVGAIVARFVGRLF